MPGKAQERLCYLDVSLRLEMRHCILYKTVSHKIVSTFINRQIAEYPSPDKTDIIIIIMIIVIRDFFFLISRTITRKQ